jgi:hypothetical protein
MKKVRVILFTLLIAVLVIGNGAQSALANAGRIKFVAILTGDQEVPARMTSAHGDAVFTLSRDGQSLRFRLKVKDINNVVAAHIHVGQPGVNGPVVVPLFGPAPAGGGPFHGILNKSVITDADVVGPLAGQGLAGLLREIMAGNTYVNVHTNDGVGDVNTGPGDFPGGEIRGLVMPLH